MARNWKDVISKTALSVGLACVLGTILVQAPLAMAETSEPKNVPVSPPVPVTPQLAKKCTDAMNQYYQCLVQQSAVYPPQGRGVCNIFIHEWQSCGYDFAKDSNVYQEQARSYWYMRSKEIQQGWEFKLKVALIGGVLDTLGLVAQKMAYETAQLILTGGDSQEPMFWNQPFGTWLTNTANQASSEFLFNIDKFVQQQAVGTPFQGISLCRKPNPLMIKMNLGMGRLALLNPRGQCTLSQLADNFEAIADMVESGDALAIQRPQFYEGGPANDLSAGLSINNAYLNYTTNKVLSAELQRTEGQGMKQITDKITGALQYPSVLANNSLMQLDPVKMALTEQDKQESYMVEAFWQAGLEGIGFIALKVFINTMALGILHKIFDPKKPSGVSVNATPEQMSIQYEVLKNADAAGDSQDLFERQEFAKALGDFVVPNFNTTVDQDLVTELSTCTQPRTRWNCAMDQALATALAVATEDGALTVGKASGVGSENSKNTGQAKGLHPDWELIPESDIKNNTDPSCFQRAYCAGNLKKLRLARIVPVGWEMAANSPYNLKKDGKYVSLSTVIRGFYECNDNGALDKDHPWCHLIDPNWIIVAPRYQCRAQGYGSTVEPQVGTRVEECGDMASCLSTNVKGECTGGYGYCLAERPVYRFDARECEEQYASCRTWNKPDGQQLSALRYTVERGNCSEDNIGCQWFATHRYVTSTASPEGLWVGTTTSGPRVYWDKGVQTCATEGCTKVFQVTPGTSALNLVQNGSFEQITQEDVNGTPTTKGFPGWQYEDTCFIKIDFDKFLGTTAVDQLQSLAVSQKACNANAGDAFTQRIAVGGGRNYVLTLYAKAEQSGKMPVSLFFYQKNPGQPNDILLNKTITAYESCANGWDANSKSLKFISDFSVDFAPHICQFVTPPNADYVVLRLAGAASGAASYDSVQLEEGEFSNNFVDGVADGLPSAYLKIAPEEYNCTGDDKTDNPACKKFARVCRQVDVGCQGYQDVEDPSAPEIPATISSKDLCPSICAGYGKYDKLASSFDLVRNANPSLDDPEDQSTEYFIPSLAEQCTLADVGCEAFTSMEAATGTGEQVSFFNELRYCQKPNDRSTTYYTWEGSDTTGYQLVTWALIREQTGNGPMVMLTGGRLGVIKDPAACDESAWKDGLDPDCRQFYDEKGVAYYRYYSQTVTSANECTKFRKDDSSQADCLKTGGTEFVPQTKSCMYDALPSQSLSCQATAGGCRAYLGPTGRNAANVFNESFVASSSLGWFTAPAGSMKFTLSKEAVLVGDTSIKMEPTPANGPIRASMALSLPSTSTLYRISFWTKAASNTVSTVSVDGKIVGQFSVTPQWKRYEFGPFYATGTTPQSSQQLQKHCGSLTYTATQSLLNKFSGSNLDPETLAASVKATLDSLLNNPSIPKNVASIEKACTDDTQCANIPVYDLDNTTVSGNTTGGSCGFVGQTSGVEFTAPANSKALYIDTLRVDQLNDTQFVRKGLWSIPAACDATYPEGVPQARAMVGCREYQDRDNNTLFVRTFGSLCNADAIGCKGFIDTHDKPNAYPQTITVKGTAGPSQRANGIARQYEDQYFGDWSVTSQAYRYFYAIDNDRARCDSGEASCRAFGKPVFTQDRLSLVMTSNTVSDLDADVYANQQIVYKFETMLMKDDWQSYVDDNGQPKLACRKDELFCNRFQSGNVTEYFRDPGTHACVWQKIKTIAKNEANGIMADGDYGGWFREGTDIPCYPNYQKNGDTFGAYFTGEDPYAGWVGKCPADQSECTEFVDPNDASNPAQPSGRSYYLVNSNKIDTRTCGGAVDPLSGCVLFNNKSVSGLQASSKATYSKVLAEKGAAQSPIDCDTEKDNPYCKAPKYCTDLKQISCGSNGCSEDTPGPLGSAPIFIKEHLNKPCNTNADCSFSDTVNPDGYVVDGTCFDGNYPNDANLIIKVKLDRECARWMGCRTGETVFDPARQAQTSQCAELVLCERNSSLNNDIYCAKMTDRSNDDYFSPGQVVNMQTYSSRKTGFGSVDYSGYTAPNQYLLADLTARNVGSELTAKSPELLDKYRLDRRLVANVPMDSGFVIAVDDPTFDKVKLCTDTRTNRVGYVSSDSRDCLLPIAEPISMNVGPNGEPIHDVSLDIQRLYNEFKNSNAKTNNAILQSAMPAPECELYPEVDSPLPNEYVAEWNTKISPPVPVKMVEGYGNLQACVYGENCSCSYRKVRYMGNVNRYYSVRGAPPAVGVCVGGKNEGTPCVPGGYVPVNSSNKVLVSVQGTIPVGNSTCGDGMCASIQDTVVQNGRYGYCLERDKTRLSSVSQGLAPCLIWSPQVVVGGYEDTTHFSPTAGYLPPQGSGEYYCVSGANEQRIVTPDPTTGWTYQDKRFGMGDILSGPYFWNPGKLSQLGYSRRDVWQAAGDDPEYTSIAIDGTKNNYVPYTQKYLDNRTRLCKTDPKETSSASNPCEDKIGETELPKGKETLNMRYACRRTSLCEGYSMADTAKYGKDPYGSDRLDNNNNEGRWIMTGDSVPSSYLEYFIPYGWGVYYQGKDNLSPSLPMYDYRFGLFRFSFVPDPVGAACKWNPRWAGLSLPTVDTKSEFTCQNYLSQIQSLSDGMYRTMSQGFPGILDRNSEKVLLDKTGVPVKMKCMTDPNRTCYYKYWETGYQDGDQSKFVWPDSVNMGKPETFDFGERFRMWFAKECRASKPYFSVRAMFQNVNSRENDLANDEARQTRLDGPWQFIGFWFTTCLPTNSQLDPGWLYMRLDIVTADVCREVAQVISPDTRQSAVFADRVWSQGGFFLPVLGIRYDTPNAPFASALATKPIGRDPMLYGASVPTSADANGTPTFIDSGAGIAPIMSRQNAWISLTNLFAKVYKVWRWDSTSVYSWDYACVKGSQFGKQCSWAANHYTGLKDCGPYASCNTEVDTNLKNQGWRCNTLSGVNRGLGCGAIDVPNRNNDPKCHNAAMAYEYDPELQQESLTPLYAACKDTGEAKFATLDTTTLGMNVLAGSPSNLNSFRDGWSAPDATYGPIVLDDPSKSPPDDKACTELYGVKFTLSSCGSGDTKRYYASPYINDVASLRTNRATACKGYQGGYALEPDFTYGTPNVAAYALMMMKIKAANCQTQIEGNLAEELQQVIDGTLSLAEFRSYANNYLKNDSYGTQISDANVIKYLQYLKTHWDNNSGQKVNYYLGLYDPQTATNLIVSKCDATKSIKDLRCGVPSDYSDECPRVIDPCGPGVTSQSVFDGGSPKCGFCTIKEPDLSGKYADNYKTLYKGTGYCIGFNPLSRCRTNNDCKFGQFEYWGGKDDGTGQGPLYETGELQVVCSQIEKQDGKCVLQTAMTKQVRLPRPLFENAPSLYQVPQQFSYPAIMYRDDGIYGTPPGAARGVIGKADYYCEDANHDRSDGNLDYDDAKSTCYYKERLVTWEYDGTEHGKYYGGYQLCPNNALRNVCAGVGKAADIGILGNNLQGVALTAICIAWCNGAVFQAPNSYAANLDGIASYSQNKNLRTAAIAPFAVNPLIRTIQSVGMRWISGLMVGATYVSGPFSTDFKNSSMYDMGLPFGLGMPDFPFPWDPVQGFGPFSYSGKSATAAVLNAINLDAYNSIFPWAYDKIYFTSLFPLVTGGAQDAADFGTVVGPAETIESQNGWTVAGYLQLQKYWSGYGVSNALIKKEEELSASMKNYFRAENFFNDDEFLRMFNSDMNENIFPTTGWGTFMKPDDARLNLYPGAVAAAVPRDDAHPEYTVFLPGHCEPPTGGTDNDTIVGKKKLGQVLTVPVTGGGSTAGPANDGGLFILPWENMADVFKSDKHYPEDAAGMKQPDILDWVGSFVDPDTATPANSVQVTADRVMGHEEGTDTPMSALNDVCRCEGGDKDGQVVNGVYDCNADLPQELNPDAMAKKDALYAVDNKVPDDKYCMPVSKSDGTPIDVCKDDKGTPFSPNPDLDDNRCTHTPGYMPRGDVCADNRGDCLVTYDLPNKQSINHRDMDPTVAPAPSATDVTPGFDTFYYLSGGRVNKDGREYVSWYRPRPPRIATPDTSQSSAAANAQKVGQLDTFSVDGRPEGLIYYGGGQGTATIRFYAWTAHNQGPIRSIKIDWGDGTIQNIDATQLKNQKPACGTDRECEFVPGLACSSDADCPPSGGACLQIGNCRKQSYKECHKDEDCGNDDKCDVRMLFGNSSDACRQGYLEYTHVYSCTTNEVEVYTGNSAICDVKSVCEDMPELPCAGNFNLCRPDEKCVYGLAPRYGCYNKTLDRCRYTPRVQVMDGWGWCTGNCSQENEATPAGDPKSGRIRHPFGGCWDGSNTKFNTDLIYNPLTAKTLVNECDDMNLDPATNRPDIVFKGSIEVAPVQATVSADKSNSLNNMKYNIIKANQLWSQYNVIQTP